jgi:toxin YoeB
MTFVFSSTAVKDIAYFKQHQPKLFKRIKKLLQALEQSPTSGIGKPEPLQFELQGCWSRRINKEHRLVYKVEKQNIYIISCRYHYSK